MIIVLKQLDVQQVRRHGAACC